jgi:hypothetical protein
MDSDVKEALNDYFKLKNNYETQIMTNKKKIMNNVHLSNREKRSEYTKLKPKCIHCKRPGGTIFSTTYIPETDSEESYRELRAFCGIVADPCNLNIRIRLAKIELLPDLLKTMEDDIKEYKNEIIDHKNKLLFGYLNTEEALEKFENIKEYISNYTSLYEQYLENYHEIVDNNEKKLELDEAITNSYIEIQKIKDCITQMNETNNVQYAQDAVSIYINVLMPLLLKIRNLKFNETIVWFNEYTNTFQLLQNKYSIEKMSFTSSNDKVLEYDVSFSPNPKPNPNPNPKKGIIIESESISEPVTEELGVVEPIYGDGLDGVKWNNTDYDQLWSKLPSGLRTGLITDREWMQEFMSNCVALRASGQPCTMVTPRNLILPPEIGPDGKANFGINIYNQLYESLPENLKKTYLTFYSEKDGVQDYTMLANAMNDLVAKSVTFGRGFF